MPEPGDNKAEGIEARLMIDTGEVVYDGSAQHVLDNEELMHKYLAI